MQEDRAPSLVWSVCMASMAGAMGWGIRGQYGHETGAMIAGLLVALVLVLFHIPQATSLFGARAAALMTLGIGVGGSMTYGQTVGLTHNQNLIGNVPALWWGLLGLAIKGGLWIGIGGAMFGLSLSGKRYTPFELAVLLISLVFCMFLGIYLFNHPYDPEQRLLPAIYFSASWYWEPDTVDLVPRRERWGGLLAVFIALVGYARLVKGDRLCLRLGLWGCLAGGLGFSLGQSVQAFHAWNPDLFPREGIWQIAWHGLNWWNVMETTFGAIWGALLAVGVWTSRHWIVCVDEDPIEFSWPAELVLGLVHVVAILVWNLGANPALDEFAGHGLTMIIVPVLAVAGGRYWPYWMVLVITLLPIAAKTGQALAPTAHELAMLAAHVTGWHDFALPDPFAVSDVWKWLGYVIVPVFLGVVASVVVSRDDNDQTTRQFARLALPLTAWTYYLLNHAFFGYPVPWDTWTGRVPNDVVFLCCAVSLTMAAVVWGWREWDFDE